MNESQNNDNQTAQTEQTERADQLTDLEPQDDVKGGGGARISKIIVDNDSTTSGDSFYGTGVYKSTDGGKTWT